MVAKLQVLEALRPGWGLDWANRSDAYGVSGIKWWPNCRFGGSEAWLGGSEDQKLANRSDAYGVSGIKWSSVCTRRGRVTLPYHRGDGLLYRAYGPSGSNNRR